VAVDVNKLIADAKAKQAAARKAAAAAQAQASKDKIDAEVQARSKNELNYANTLKPRLQQYESQLAIWARKIARGDKLSGVEQKEFDRLVRESTRILLLFHAFFLPTSSGSLLKVQMSQRAF
jgi:hypothetical protein